MAKVTFDLPHPTLTTGSTCVEYPLTLPVGYRLCLRQPLTVPWPVPRRGEQGLALLVVKAAVAASQLGLDELQFAYWVAERALHALSNQATCATVQACTGS